MNKLLPNSSGKAVRGLDNSPTSTLIYLIRSEEWNEEGELRANKTKRRVLKAESAAEFTELISKKIFEGSNSLNDLRASLDDFARVTVVRHIGYYVGRYSEKKVIADRKQRGQRIIDGFSKHLTALRRAYKARVAFEELKVPPFGKISERGNPYWAGERERLSSILCTEVLRLNAALGDVRRLYNMKRFGNARHCSGRHYRLLLAQEFVRAWSLANLQKEISLTVINLAQLIDVFFLAGRK